MSYLDKLKNNSNTEKKNTEIKIKPGWIILSKENYINKLKNKSIQSNNVEPSPTITPTNNEKNTNQECNENIYSKRDYCEDFYIKYGSSLLDFFIDMRDNFENNCYNILNIKERGTNCFSYDFERFVMKHTNMINEESNDNDSNDSEFDDDNIIF